MIEGKGIQILTKHDGFCPGAVHAAVGQLAVVLPGGQVEQLAGSIFLYCGVRQIDAGGIGPGAVSVVVVPGEQIRLGNADVLL